MNPQIKAELLAYKEITKILLKSSKNEKKQPQTNGRNNPKRLPQN